MFTQPNLMSQNISKLKDEDIAFINRVDEVEKEFIKAQYKGLNDNHFKYYPEENQEKPYKVLVGQGEFSVVRLAKAIVDNKPYYFALKKVKPAEALQKSRIKVKLTHEDVINNTRKEQKFMQEIEKINNGIEHYIALPYKYIQKSNKKSEPQIYQILPLADIGNLRTFRNYVFSSQNFSRPDNLEVFRLIALKLLKTVSLLHDQNIYNQDIKMDNILLSTEGNLWLSDFGSAMMVENDVNGYEQCQLVSGYSDSKYIHPKQAECMRDKIQLKPSVWGLAHDKWALGITLLKILSPDTNQIAKKLSTVNYLEQCSTYTKVLELITVFRELPIYLKEIILDLLNLDINNNKPISSLLKQHLPVEVNCEVSEPATQETLKLIFNEVLLKAQESGEKEEMEEIEEIDEVVSEEKNNETEPQKHKSYAPIGTFFQVLLSKNQELEVLKLKIRLQISQYHAVIFAADLESNLEANQYKSEINTRFTNNEEIKCIFYLNKVGNTDEYCLIAYLKNDANQEITEHELACVPLDDDAGPVLEETIESFANQFLEDNKLEKNANPLLKKAL